MAAVRYLLSVDADPNSAHTASGYNTPLHEAARSGSLAVTRLLLKSSANVLAANAHGDHPLHVACREGRLDIARRLLAHDSDWATVAARNHAGLRPSEVVIGCWALKTLLEQAEVKAAEISKASAGGSIGVGGTDASSPSLMRTKPTRQHGGMTRRGAGALRRKPNNKVGLSVRSSTEDASAKALLSGSILPRWARLARPLDEEQRRQRGPLDGRERRHNRLPRVEGVGAVKAVDPILSEGSEAQSFAGWSGTSYGASLADSDFEIPEAAGSPGDRSAAVVGGTSAATRREIGCEATDT